MLNFFLTQKTYMYNSEAENNDTFSPKIILIHFASLKHV